MTQLDLSNINFSKLNKQASNSFFEHKKLIIKLGKGQEVLCKHCKAPLKLIVASELSQGVRCLKGCTKIELEVD